MNFSDIAIALKGIPYTQVERGKVLYNHVISTKPKNCLELGFAHGVASCYIAAALDEIGDGHLDCCDLDSSEKRNPNLEALLAQSGLTKYVTIHREKNSYNWFLKKKIELQTSDGSCEPCYDLCFIDGPKNWTIDGLAFFLQDKLLCEQGYVLFDDLQWTLAEYSKDTIDGICGRDLSDDQVREPNIEAVFRLCVMQHPDYSEFEIDEDWAWAQKRRSSVKSVRYTTTQSFKYKFLKKFRALVK